MTGLINVKFRDLVVYSYQFTNPVPKGNEIKLNFHANWMNVSYPHPAALQQGDVNQYYKFSGNLYLNSPYKSNKLVHIVE